MRERLNCVTHQLEWSLKISMKVHYSSETNEWATPQDFYDKLDKEFQFNLDPCSTKENAKCDKFFTIEDDGLSQSWVGYNVFMNPPYGREIKFWIEKALNETLLGAERENNRCVFNPC